ncbi:PTS sugar transporter subunit IIA [Rhizobium sp. LjRoot30]|uniref:PTS sugar transporter subunit IIA n=1 Tax=Rhizobium sp. LjRoot30 TaxID=3342320 RepID=UPI003ED0D66C
MKISDLISPGSVLAHVSVSNKNKLLQLAADTAAAATGLDAAAIFKGLVNREKLGSTGIGEGVAIPHARYAGLNDAYGLVIRPAKPVDFEAIDDIPVDVVFVFLTPEGDRGDHLNALSAIARRLRTDSVLRNVRQARDADQLYAALIADDPA